MVVRPTVLPESPDLRVRIPSAPEPDRPHPRMVMATIPPMRGDPVHEADHPPHFDEDPEAHFPFVDESAPHHREAGEQEEEEAGREHLHHVDGRHREGMTTVEMTPVRDPLGRRGIVYALDLQAHLLLEAHELDRPPV